MGEEAEKPKAPKGRTKAELEAIVDELTSAMRTIRANLVDLVARVVVLEIAKPAHLRAMSFMEIEKAIRDGVHGQVKFEVLQKWEFMGEVYQPGRILVAAQYRNLLDFVRSGLKLAFPVDGGALEKAAIDAAKRHTVADAVGGNSESA